MVAYAQSVAEERFEAGYDLSEVQSAFNVLEESVWTRAVAALEPEQLAQTLGLVSTALGCGKNALARKYVSLPTRTHAPSLDLRALFGDSDGTYALAWASVLSPEDATRSLAMSPSRAPAGQAPGAPLGGRQMPACSGPSAKVSGFGTSQRPIIVSAWLIMGFAFGVLCLLATAPIHSDPSKDAPHWVVGGLIALNTSFALIAFLKGKTKLGAFGIFVPGIAVVAALRLAKPTSL